MSDYDTTDAMLDAAWAQLDLGAQGPQTGTHWPVLATIDPEGRPQQRTLVLRGADRAAGMLTLMTDADSAKVRELRDRPRASVLTWDAESRLQLRLACTVTLRENDRDVWSGLGETARQNYGKTPPVGTEIAAPLDYEITPAPGNLAILRLTVESLEVLHLGETHRRAVFSRKEDWRGRWLSP
ncbi:pyridoxamine 5'-phosphate oxidase family protein [Histidinibacterium aquaticum]|uniref:Pyridoxamine 5'-phosphate oxidase n=1 Tax=Histidinibacterium aquaticum TaxID=2613962 RepID=A0A5J5GFI6_9RHOB|nr:pyridoxamine 5'-phosphate oxidase family protein [Histidinibacterium aquaticum]KAA9006999.1 pyridoxamine 5'-phosphate oxidase [Histidinibacterium aquaticum]